MEKLFTVYINDDLRIINEQNFEKSTNFKFNLLLIIIVHVIFLGPLFNRLRV